jgi:hypothetical protein
MEKFSPENHKLKLHSEDLEIQKATEDTADIESMRSKLLESSPTTRAIDAGFNDWLTTQQNSQDLNARRNLMILTKALISITPNMLENQGIPGDKNEHIVRETIMAQYALARYVDRSNSKKTGEASLYSETLNYLTMLDLSHPKLAERMYSRFKMMLKVSGSAPELFDNAYNAVKSIAALSRCIDGIGDDGNGLEIQKVLAEKSLKRYRQGQPGRQAVEQLYRQLQNSDQYLSVLPSGTDDAVKKVDLGVWVPSSSNLETPRHFQDIVGPEHDWRNQVLCLQVKTYGNSKLSPSILIYSLNMDIENIENDPYDLPGNLQEDYQNTLDVYREEGLRGLFVVMPKGTYDIEKGVLRDLSRDKLLEALGSAADVVILDNIDREMEPSADTQVA